MSSKREDEITGVGQVTGFPTVSGGKPHESVDEPGPESDVIQRSARKADDKLVGQADFQASRLTGGDLARAALESARRGTAEAASAGPPPPSRDARRRAANRRSNKRRGGYSGSGPDARDPQAVGGILSNLFAERGWEQPLAEARVFADWPGLVGPEIAARCQPVLLRDGELKIAAESTAWATQLRIMSSSILKQLVDELGPRVVTKLMITGPVGPSWKHGGWSVRGHRGPRDTYG